MNQILYNGDNNSFNYIGQKSNKTRVFKVQFVLSICLFFIISVSYFINFQIRNSNESISHQISGNYNILQLYNKAQSNPFVYTNNNQTFTIIGMIEIPKIKIYYPIISESKDELLKIAPCRVSGPNPNEDGNLCIAGHNYDNYKFFSKLSNLSNNDEILIHDLNGNKLLYHIFRIYEVAADDLSPLRISKNIKKEVTLITCNNFNSSNRVIIKAKKEGD